MLYAAALLHDVGHSPLSHSGEEMFGLRHEIWSGRIIREHAALRGPLERCQPGLADAVADLLEHGQHPCPAMLALVSSQLDCDRLDYLLRDGHYSGAGYATYDLDWILHALAVEDVRAGADDPRDLVIDYRRGMYAVEQYLFARSYMYAQVYHHKTEIGRAHV